MAVNFNNTYKEITKELLDLSINENAPYNKMLEFLTLKMDEYQINNEQKIRVLSSILPQMTLQFTSIAMQTAVEVTREELNINPTLENLKKQGRLLEAQISKLVAEERLVISQQSENEEQRSVKLSNLRKQGLALDKNIEGIAEQIRSSRIKNAEAEEQRADKLANLKKQGRLLEAQIAKLTKEQELAHSQQRAIDKQVVDNRLIKVGSMLSDYLSTNQTGGLNMPTGMHKFYMDLLYEMIKSDISGISKVTDFTMTNRPK